jgi:signal peptide peptidase SppA
VLTAGLIVSFALNAILNTQWAITEEALREMIQIVERQSMDDISALEKIRGTRMKSAERATIRGGVGIIPVRGPLFKRANLMTEICGATSYEMLRRDLHEMVSSPDVKAIVLDVDSPGGDANGCSELSDAIHEARGQKPIVSYVGGTGASAAYWIASASDRIYASDSAILGSIGVQSAVRTDKEPGVITFRSSQSPNKNPAPDSDEGKKEIQSVIDGLAEVFVSKVARNRGISPAEVLAKFGQGAVFVGKAAQERGIIDEVSTLENVISKYGAMKVENEAITAELIAGKYPDVAAHFMKLGAEQAQKSALVEKKRVESIRKLAEGKVSEEFCTQLIESGADIKEAALQILIEEKTNPPKTKEDPRKAFDKTFAGLDVPPKEDAKGLDAEQDAILAIAEKVDGIKVRRTA